MLTLTRDLNVALQALTYLATRPLGTPQPLSPIAQQCGCSENTLSRIFSLCAQAGLMRVQRGRQGGFHLNRPLEQITINEVIEALHSQADVLFCPCPHRYEGCNPQNCPVNVAWRMGWQTIQQTLRHTTVAELVCRPEKSCKETPLPPMEAPTSQGQSLIGQSAAIQRVREVIRKVAPTEVSILLQGETGTGKDLVAWSIHQASSRRDKPLISINCAAIPATLLENELFGHGKGAYTAADRAYKGAFQQAEGSTLYLDEIGEIPLEIQAKLLRAVETKVVTPLGGAPVKVDVRIIASTNRDLKEMVHRGAFRVDLFYRLTGVTIRLPPLRERREDIACLTDYFLKRYTVLSERAVRLSPDAYALLKAHSWPGNVRELESLLQRVLLLTEKSVLDAVDFACYLDMDTSTEGNELLPLQEALERYERQYLCQVLVQTHGDKACAARLLGIDLSTLYRKLAKYDI